MKINVHLSHSTLRSELEKLADVNIYGPEDENLRTSIISFSSSRVNSRNIVDKLGENEIIFAERDVGGGTKAVRASPHFFNSEEEATRAVDYVKNILNGSI